MSPIKFKCEQCGKRFKSEKDVSQHTMSKHGIREKEPEKELKPTKTYLVVAVAIAALLCYLLISYLTSPGKYDEFAKCLTEKGYILAGTDWCSNCQSQKSVFGKSFEYVAYKDCDHEKKWCESKGVTAYPTWILPNGGRSTGTKTIRALDRMATECSLSK